MQYNLPQHFDMMKDQIMQDGYIMLVRFSLTNLSDCRYTVCPSQLKELSNYSSKFCLIEVITSISYHSISFGSKTEQDLFRVPIACAAPPW